MSFQKYLNERVKRLGAIKSQTYIATMQEDGKEDKVWGITIEDEGSDWNPDMVQAWKDGVTHTLQEIMGLDVSVQTEQEYDKAKR